MSQSDKCFKTPCAINIVPLYLEAKPECKSMYPGFAKIPSLLPIKATSVARQRAHSSGFSLRSARAPEEE
jgi:hypothetical protein